jgi:hypothetical protein
LVFAELGGGGAGGTEGEELARGHGEAMFLNFC